MRYKQHRQQIEDLVVIRCDDWKEPEFKCYQCDKTTDIKWNFTTVAETNYDNPNGKYRLFDINFPQPTPLCARHHREILQPFMFTRHCIGMYL